MNKSLGTNLVAFLIVITGGLLKNDTILAVGLFALSGAITNWLAIYMLFEKVPFLYGSGVVENRFEQFKASIYTLIMDQFFTKENLKKFFNDEFKDDKNIDLTKVIEKTDFSIAFESLKEAVMESSFGGMLGMFGGVKALEPLKEPFTSKMRTSIVTIVSTKSFQEILKQSLNTNDISDDIYDKISIVVNKRLDELTPKIVKELVQQMIKEHLGWLVIWGGVFGGLIGLIGSFVLVI
jgi:uncharacterized membrane protein YheB (UPF0754 family)